MVTREEILRFIAQRAKEGRVTRQLDLMHEFGLSDSATRGRLMALWKQRMISATTVELASWGAERLSDLRFRLTPRGLERLRWHERQNRPARRIL